MDETLRLVQAFQYTDHKGEGKAHSLVCLFVCCYFSSYSCFCFLITRVEPV